MKRDGLLSNLNLRCLIFWASAFVLVGTLAADGQNGKRTNQPNQTQSAPPAATPSQSSSPTNRANPSATPSSVNSNKNATTPTPNSPPIRAASKPLNSQDSDPVVVLTAPTPTPTPQPTPTPAPTAAELLQKRLAHARALAVVGNYPMAISELLAVRMQATDEAMRDVASIMLISIQVKTGNYAHASAMLQESFNARAKGGENSTRLFFALTGQMLKAVRARLDRYHEFGVMTTDLSAPEELRGDLDGMRKLLEQVVEQAKNINNGEGDSMDATALIEDAASLRVELARDAADHAEWQRQVAEARVELATSSPKKKKKNASAIIAHNSSTLAAPPNSNAHTNASAPGNASAQTPSAEDKSKANAAEIAAHPTNARSEAKNDTKVEKKEAAKGNPSAGNSAVSDAPAQLISVGSLVEKATQRVAPSYPPTARNARISGTVTVYLIVDEKGQVKDVQNATGPELLRGAAQDAARRWRFQPTYINGQPVRVSGFITFNFSL